MSQTQQQAIQTIREWQALPPEALPRAYVLDGDDENAGDLLHAMARGESAIEMGTLGTRIEIGADRPGYPKTIRIW